MKSRFMLAGLLLGLVFSFLPEHGWAQTPGQILNCDTLPALEGNRRAASHGADENCVRWADSTAALSIYTPAHPEGETPAIAARRNAKRVMLKSAVETAMRKYRELHFISGIAPPAIRLWVVKSIPPTGVAADANALSRNAPCVVHLYQQAVSTDSEDSIRQLLAHELFHCVQFSQLGQPYAPATYWWMEGSAEWASSLVMPRTNREFDSTAAYHQHEILFDQCDPEHYPHCNESYGIYATALFFADMTQQKGTRAVFNLLRSMPSSTDPRAQYPVFSAYPDMDHIFQKFAQDYMDQQIVDPGTGGREYMDQPEPQYSRTMTINSNRAPTIQGTPLVIYAYKFIFKKGHSYKVSGLQNKDRFLVSYHMGDTPWVNNPGPEPVEIDPGCSDLTGVVLITSAEDTPEIRRFRVQITASDTSADSTCPCACVRPAPQCVMGNWRSTEAPQLDLFVNAISGLNKTGKNSVTFENGSARVDRADLKLNIGPSGRFTHSTAINYHGEGRVSDQNVAVKGNMHGTAQGTVCSAVGQQLCFQYNAVSLPSQFQVSMMGMTVPIPTGGGTFEGSITTPYSCAANALTLKVPLPPPPDAPADVPKDITVRYHH